MSSNIGIDISGVQDIEVPGDWEFVVVKSTEGLSVANPKVNLQWAAAAKARRRGLYHYARPARSRGGVQADVFANDALNRGFKPGKDMWQLDCEGMLNDGVTGAQWAAFINDFMPRALQRLGPLGFLYVGMYFFGDQLRPLCERYNWWLPYYGDNKGQIHDLPAGVNPVIHQFTSNGGLDRNVIHDPARWNALVGVQPATKQSVPEEDDDMLIPRRAIAHPAFAGRVGFIKFDKPNKQLLSFNGIDFDRNQSTKVWQISEGFGLVIAKLLLPTKGTLEYGETPDGGGVVITADGDGGTFVLPYKELAPANQAAPVDYKAIAEHIGVVAK